MQARHVLIGGGTGFIGKRLCQLLLSEGYEVTLVSRTPGIRKITWHELEENGLPRDVTDVVNLAGQNIFDPTRRWSINFRENVWTSRVNTAAAMVKAISRMSDVKSFTNVTGVAAYKPSDKVLTEYDLVEGFDFFSRLCIHTEKAATLPEESTCRNIIIRCGVVLGREGGIVRSLYLPFRIGLGGPMGKGSQPFPWIHIIDICRFIKFCIENTRVNGIFNGVAPEIITNKEFSSAFASSLKRPAWCALPEFVVNALYGNERSVLILTGSKINPDRVLAAGFNYKYPTIESACGEIVYDH